jgi:hypothetical protein
MLSGILTAYPVDSGALDWAILEGHFTPKKPPSPAFVSTFSSGAQEHYHYEDGITQG